MKKFSAHLFASILLFLAIGIMSAHAETDGEWTFSYSDSTLTATVTRYNGSATSVTIPSTLSRQVSYQEQDDEGKWHTRYRTYTYTVTATSGTFSGNTALVSASLPSTVKSIGSSTFYNCTSLTVAPIHSDIISIGSSAFQGCTGLTLISTPSSLTYLGGYAFAGCTGLTQARIDGTDLTVSAYAFQDCTSLKSIIIGNGVTVLQASFKSSSLNTYYYNPFVGCNALETIEVGTGVTAAQEYLFHKLPALREVTFHGNVTSVGPNAFSYCQNLVRLAANGSLGQVGYQAFYECRSLESISDLSACAEISSYAFYNCVNLEASIHLTVCRAIGDFAFYGCARLTGVEFSNSLTSIGTYAFYGSSGLTTISTPPSLTSLGGRAFEGCTGLTQARIDGNGLTMSLGIFANCSSLRRVDIGNGVVKIDSYVSSLGVQTSYTSAFNGCTSLETVEIGTGVTTVQSHLFRNLASLRGVTFHGDISQIGEGAFNGCTGLVDLVLGGRPTAVGPYAFYGCGNLTGTVDLSRCATIGDCAFYNCGAWAFGGLSLNAIATIGYDAFRGCMGLTAVEFSDNLTSIKSCAFQGCTGLTSISTPSSLTSLGGSAFKDCTGLTQARIDGTNLGVPTDVFQYCTKLKSVIIGDGITSLQTSVPSYPYAPHTPFGGCIALETVEVGTGVTTVQQYLFNKLPTLRAVTFHGSVTSVGVHAFEGCSALETVSLGGSPVYVGDSAFDGCGRITGDLDLSQCETIGSYAFEGCSLWAFGNLNLAKVQQGIGKSTFKGCTGLTGVEFAKGLTSIGAFAFENCHSLSNAWFKGTPPSVDIYAFFGVASGARGHYPRSLSTQWLPHIDSNGKWNGLIMHELSQPILRVDSASPVDGTITLAWDDGTDGQCVSSYSIYRSANDTYTETNRVATGITDTEWTDTNYWNAEPVLSPLNYWVVAESDHFDLPESNSVETRHRYGLSVGLGSYGSNMKEKPLVQARKDAELAAENMSGMAGFTRVKLLPNAEAKVSDIRREIQSFAKEVKTGDTFVFYISTHGGTNTAPHMVAYDDYYWMGDFQRDLFSITNTASLVEIVMTCHSESLVDGSLANPNSVKWLASHGFGQCRANTAWIAACGVEQYASTYNETYSSFGEWFLNQGWKNGMADRDIRGFPNYVGGNRNGMLSLLEIAEYASKFACGISDAIPADLAYENENVLSRVFVGEVSVGNVPTRPNPPMNLTASAGLFDSKISLAWEPSDGATAYRVFRSEPDVATPSICRSYSYRNGVTAEDGFKLAFFSLYTYSVKAINPSGISDESNYATGWAGSAPFAKYLWHQYLDNTDDLPIAWLNNAQVLSAAANSVAANNMNMYDCYISGLSPTDPSARLTTYISVTAEGQPMISWSPDLNEGGRKHERVYTVEGRESLTDGDWGPTNAASRFFRVKVSMP